MPPVYSLPLPLAQGLGLISQQSLSVLSSTPGLTPSHLGYTAEDLRPTLVSHLSDTLLTDRLGSERVSVLQRLVDGHELEENEVLRHLQDLEKAYHRSAYSGERTVPLPLVQFEQSQEAERAAEEKRALEAKAAQRLKALEEMDLRRPGRILGVDGQPYSFGQGPKVVPVQRIFISNRSVAAASAIRYLRGISEEYGFPLYISVPLISQDEREPWIRDADVAIPVPVRNGETPDKAFKDIERMVAAAKAAGADAVDPMWGFVSEKGAFAQAVQDAGMLFVGPPPSAMQRMGHKRNGLVCMKEVGGAAGEFSENFFAPFGISPEEQAALMERAHQAVTQLGFPHRWVMLKDNWGGGGTGNRVLKSWEDWEKHVKTFIKTGHDSPEGCDFFFEQFMGGPGSGVKKLRHIEFQVIADRYGNAVIVGWRDCTWQRKDQKVFELTSTEPELIDLLRSMYPTLAEVTRKIGYVGAGTYEFLAVLGDNDQWRLKFMEMNTRLQVEHTITNIAYEVDLYKLKLLTTMGYPLPLTQSDIVQKNVAIEARILAEDARFNPQPGRVTTVRIPKGRRILSHAGITDGSNIPGSFDSMFDQLVGWEQMPPHDPADVPSYAKAMAAGHEGARANLLRGVKEYKVGGVQTNLPLLAATLETDEFKSNVLHLGTLVEKFGPEKGVNAGQPTTEEMGSALLVAAATLYKEDARRAQDDLYRNRATLIDRGRIPEAAPRNYQFRLGGAVYEVQVARMGLRTLQVTVNGVLRTIDSSYIGTNHMLMVDDRVVNTEVSVSAGNVNVHINGKKIAVENAGEGGAVSGNTVKSPMPGKVIRVLVAPGQEVKVGDPVAVVEAMKMENEVQSDWAGTVGKVYVNVGAAIEANAKLMTLTSQGSGEEKEKSGEEGVDFALPKQIAHWVALRAREENGIGEVQGELQQNFDERFGQSMSFLKAFFLGFDIPRDHADRVFDIVHPVLQDLTLAPRQFSAYLNSFISIYLAMQKLTTGQFKREMLRLWHHLEYPGDFHPTREFSELVLGLFREYGIPVERREDEEKKELPDQSLLATLNARPGVTRKALLQVMETVNWGLTDRQAHLQKWVGASVVSGNNQLTPNLQRLYREEPWSSHLKKIALEALKFLDLRGYQEIVPPPVDNTYAEIYQAMLDNPLGGISQDTIEKMKASLKAPFDESPFQNLPRAFVDVGELRRHYAEFHLRPLVSFIERTAVYEMIPKDAVRNKESPYQNDRRFLVVSWVNQRVPFNRNEAGEIEGAPAIERAYINAVRAIAAYKKFEDPKAPHTANRPVVFALTQDFDWDESGDPTKFGPEATLRIAGNINRFGDAVASFSSRTFVNLRMPGESEPTRRIVHHYQKDGDLKFQLQSPEADVVAKPRTDVEISSILQRARGKLLVEERLNRLFGEDQWEEIRLEKEGWDKPGRPSAVKIGFGYRKGRKVAFVGSDFRVVGGTVDKAVGEKMAWIRRKAREMGIPIVKVYDSGGARVDAGVPALDGAASTMRETVLSQEESPSVTAIMGPCAGMAAYDPSISQGPVAFLRSRQPEKSTGQMYLTGKDVVKEVLNIDVTNDALGGADAHMRDTGVADVAFDTEHEVLDWVGAYLDFVLGIPFELPEAAKTMPSEGDLARKALRKVVDGGQLFELKPDYGSVITALARINGRNVGIISSYPQDLEEMTYRSLRKIEDFVNLCEDNGIPIVKDQRSPWLFGDRMQSSKIARWSDRVDNRLHQVKSKGRSLLISILYPGTKEFNEGHANASSDLIVAVLDPKSSPAVADKVRGYADFVVASEAEAYELVGRLPALFAERERPTSDPNDRDVSEIFDWVLPDRAEEPFDMNVLMRGGDAFQVTKIAAAEAVDALVKRMTGEGVPADLKVHPNREVSESAPWVEGKSQRFPKGFFCRAYKFEDDRVAVQFKAADHRVEGLLDKDTPLVEFMKDFGRTVITGWAYLGGKLVGVIANQPMVQAAVANIDSSEKIERFKRFCAKMGVRLRNLVVMPGFKPGEEEIIDIGGKLLIAEVEYPEEEGTLDIGQNTGGGYIERSSRYIRGAVIERNGRSVYIPFNYVGGLPSAKIMVMGAKGAIKIVKEYKKRLDAAPKDQRAQVQREIERYHNEVAAHPDTALKQESIDEVVPFGGARAWLIRSGDESAARIRLARDHEALSRYLVEGAGVLTRVLGAGHASGFQRLIESARLLQEASLGIPVDSRELKAAQALVDGLLLAQSPSTEASNGVSSVSETPQPPDVGSDERT